MVISSRGEEASAIEFKLAWPGWAAHVVFEWGERNVLARRMVGAGRGAEEGTLN